MGYCQMRVDVFTDSGLLLIGGLLSFIVPLLVVKPVTS